LSAPSSRRFNSSEPAASDVGLEAAADPSVSYPRTELINIVLPLEQSEDRNAWKRAAAEKLKIAPDRIGGVALRKHSIDARQRLIKVQLSLEVAVDSQLPPQDTPKVSYPSVPANARRIVIVGCGPAGIFAALRAIETGLKPIILERGKDVLGRRFDLPPILQKGVVNPESNYCFGEGGAGTFSDGKLYTRATKRGPLAKVYETFVAHGAPDRILVDAHPHIGSNLLPKIVMNMRKSILDAGGEVHFQSKVIDLVLEGRRFRSVITQDGSEWNGDALILATGHSARDIYELFQRKNLRLEAKPFAVGVRIEHPQPLIDSLQYHLKLGEKRPPLLPAANYHLATKIDGRGVHSFCMCPGGFIVPTATSNDEVVVNGMSLSRRDSPFANSGMVVTVEPEDTLSYSKEASELRGISFQRELEKKTKAMGGGGQTAPGQRLIDFLEHRSSADLPETSYVPGISSTDLHQLFPQAITKRLETGLTQFGRKMKGFVTREAVLIAVESRTSSPVRIPRDPATLEHPEVGKLFPCGEGAGFAGGIASAALDGMRCAEAAARE
jgi:uncharacterized protein